MLTDNACRRIVKDTYRYARVSAVVNGAVLLRFRMFSDSTRTKPISDVFTSEAACWRSVAERIQAAKSAKVGK